jgi:predicted secreted protein
MTQPPPPGYPPQQPPAGQAPDNYLVWSILATLFCCLPFGIVAIVKSTQVSGLWAQGQYGEAQASADAAKKWVKWSVIAAVIAYVLYGAVLAVLALTADNTTSAAALTALF